MSDYFFRIGRRCSAQIVAATFCMTLALAVTGSVRAADEKTYPILGACEESEDVFPSSLDFSDPIERLSEDYHQTVDAVVSAHAEQRAIACSDNLKETPSAALRSLAEKLPPWKDSEDLNDLAETDIGPVLLEYLRMYECALKEELFFMPSRVANDVELTNVVHLPVWLRTFAGRWRRIGDELFFARKTLNRTLTYIGGADRLRPVDASLECLQRSSLDIRNILGLTADASACLPRAWDARTSLRDAASSSSAAAR